jgi:ribonucleoside-diphosphate reductase beta chain
MKSMDWDENEFNFSSCLAEFKSCDPFTAELMIKTLSWQWETDSIAARSIYAITAPYITSNELNVLYQEIGKNECLHALTYSEIVRFSFDDRAEGILNKVLSNQDAFKRLYIASEIFNHTYEVGHKVALGLIDRNSIEAYEAIFMFIVAMYCLERIQFMASFAVTFTIANTGIFVPIGTAVQKICQDELLHAKAARTILDYELSTERGLMTFNKLKSKINNLIDEIVLSESNWNHNSLFADNTDCVGLNADQLDKWVYWNAKEVYNFFGCKPSHEQIQFPESNPLWFLDEWIEIDKVQKSPQEEKTGAYLLGGIIHNHDDSEFKIDGIY